MSLQRWLERDASYSKNLQLKRKRGVWHAICVFFAHSGDSWFWLIALVLIWFFGNPEWHTRASFLIIGLVFLAICVLIIKFSIKRPRPEGEWGNIYRATDPHSFPSGHAARAAALAVIALRIGPTWFAIVLCLWAPLVGIARVRLGVHYLSDVIIGWLIGIIVAILAIALLPVMQNLLPFMF